MKNVVIVEVGPRDGLQNESKSLPLDIRLEFIKRLSKAGLKRIEVGAFVSPQWVPQMSGTGDLIQMIQQDSELKKPKTFDAFSVLVPNMKGMEGALSSGIREVAVFGACSEAFSKKNINCTIDESFERFKEVIAAAKKKKIKVRGYLSTAFGCPYEGCVEEKKVIELVKRMLKLGVYEVSVGDTIGVATPKQVESMLKKLKRAVPLKKIAMHFHDTRGTALANVVKSLELGVRTFDSSAGGIGGCPYAKGASGNLATDDLVYLLRGLGYSTGVELQTLLETSNWIQNSIGHGLPSRLAQAGDWHPSC